MILTLFPNLKKNLYPQLNSSMIWGEDSKPSLISNCSHLQRKKKKEKEEEKGSEQRRKRRRDQKRKRGGVNGKEGEDRRRKE